MGYYLACTEPPIAEPITLQEALLQCHALEGVEDDFFFCKIAAGRRKVEDFTHRALLRQKWVLTYDDYCPSMVVLPRSPVIALESVIVDGEPLDPLPPVLDGLPSRIKINVGGGCPLRVEYVAGYGDEPKDVPETLRDAIKLFVGWSYENRAAETEVPRAFYDLIRPYQLWV